MPYARLARDRQMIEDATEVKDEWRNAIALAATAAMILAGSPT
jgi:hypothetical protein